MASSWPRSRASTRSSHTGGQTSTGSGGASFRSSPRPARRPSASLQSSTRRRCARASRSWTRRSRTRSGSRCSAGATRGRFASPIRWTFRGRARRSAGSSACCRTARRERGCRSRSWGAAPLRPCTPSRRASSCTTAGAGPAGWTPRRAAPAPRWRSSTVTGARKQPLRGRWRCSGRRPGRAWRRASTFRGGWAGRWARTGSWGWRGSPRPPSSAGSAGRRGSSRLLRRAAGGSSTRPSASSRSSARGGRRRAASWRCCGRSTSRTETGTR
mmetsp:Transcript_34970/g.115916  ORF Transcript_34970/g.115916 Transcript_34970/m.115916 type:complete len:271 (+) Transcript_34970:182-994(+)